MKNMDQKMLDDPDMLQGFEKCNDDLVIKYSTDLVDGQHKWRAKANRKMVADLKLKQEVFGKNEKSLMAKDVEEDDAQLPMSNRVIKCVSGCKKSHGRTFTAIEEKWKWSEKSLHTVLDSEIRFRKFTFFTVKATCPLFKQ